MVFLTVARFTRNKMGPDEFWKKRRVFKLASHFIGRTRNCYSIAIRMVHRSLQACTKGRIQKKKDYAELWEQRITGGAEEHGIEYMLFRTALTRSNILLNRKTLADLAVWEPRTFKALTDIAKARGIEDNMSGSQKIKPPKNIITRGLLEK